MFTMRKNANLRESEVLEQTKQYKYPLKDKYICKEFFLQDQSKGIHILMRRFRFTESNIL